MRKLLPPFLFLLSILMMFALNISCPARFVWNSSFRALGLLPVIAGLALSAWGSMIFKRMGTNIKTFDEPGILVVEGPFRYSRNPMYLGFAITLIGIAIISGNFCSFLGCLFFILVTHFWYIGYEEELMGKKFGESYEEYKLTTPRWLGRSHKKRK